MQDIFDIVPEVSIRKNFIHSVSSSIFVSMLNVLVSKVPLKLGVGTPEIGGRLYAG